MSAFIYPSNLPGLTFDNVRSVITKTGRQEAVSGKESRIGYMQYPLYRFDLVYELLRDNLATSELKALWGLYEAMLGTFDTFLFTDPAFNAVTAEPFGTGDASTVAFQLIAKYRNAGGPGLAQLIQNLNGAPQIFRQDWQGNQLMYATPRTNLCTNGQTPGGTGWSASTGGTATAPTITTGFAPGPDSVAARATRLQANQGAGATFSDFSLMTAPAYSAVNGSNYIHSVWIKSNTGSSQTVYLAHSGAGAIAITATTSWQRFPCPWVASSTGPINPHIGTRGTICPGGNVLDILVAYEQLELVAGGITTPTSYINTTSAQVTFTDYTLGPTAIITFTIAPLMNAALTWTGAFYYRCRFEEDELSVTQFMQSWWKTKTVTIRSIKL